MHLLHGSIEHLGDCADAALRYFLTIETKHGAAPDRRQARATQTDGPDRIRIEAMAYATQTQAAPLSLLARFAEIREQAVEAYSAWRVYRTTVNELRNLTARDMADLGIHPSQIRAIALDAAYGQAR